VGAKHCVWKLSQRILLTPVVCVAVMFCFVMPNNKIDREIYTMLQRKTLASAVYQSKWLINSHIFEAEYFMYVAFEGNYDGVLSLDVIIVEIGDTEIHMSSRYVVKYKPCASLKGTIKRDTTGCKFRCAFNECSHLFYPNNFLRLAMKEIFNYLYCEGFSENPSTDYAYHMRELARKYKTIVSEHLIKQIISATSLLYINNSVMEECLCNVPDDCVCKPVFDYFFAKKLICLACLYFVQFVI
jgi:hypothetical protein